WLTLVSVSFLDFRVGPEVESALFAARVATLRLPADDGFRSEYHYVAGVYRLTENKIDAALDELPQAIAGWARPGARHDLAQAAGAELHLGLAYGDGGDWERSRAHLERALAGFREQDSPQRAAALSGLARIAVSQERFADAERLSMQVLALGEQRGDDVR